MIEKIEPLGPHHDRGAFSCGVKDINDFLVAFNLDLPDPPHRIYVGVNALGQILGYYSLRPIMWEVEGRYGKIVGHLAEIDLMMIGVATALQGNILSARYLCLALFKEFWRSLRGSAVLRALALVR